MTPPGSNRGQVKSSKEGGQQAYSSHFKASELFEGGRKSQEGGGWHTVEIMREHPNTFDLWRRLIGFHFVLNSPKKAFLSGKWRQHVHRMWVCSGIYSYICSATPCSCKRRWYFWSRWGFQIWIIWKGCNENRKAAWVASQCMLSESVTICPIWKDASIYFGVASQCDYTQIYSSFQIHHIQKKVDTSLLIDVREVQCLESAQICFFKTTMQWCGRKGDNWPK